MSNINYYTWHNIIGKQVRICDDDDVVDKFNNILTIDEDV